MPASTMPSPHALSSAAPIVVDETAQFIPDANSTSPNRDPKTLDELYAAGSVLRPTYNIMWNDRAILTPESDITSNDFLTTVPFLLGNLTAFSITEEQFVRALVAMERAKRRIAFHDQFANYKIPKFMNNPNMVRIHPDTRLFEVTLTKEFFEQLRQSNFEVMFAGAVGHEYGHVAFFNGLISLMPGIDPIVASASVLNWMHQKYIAVGKAEILSEHLTRAVLGEEAYAQYLAELMSQISNQIAMHIQYFQSELKDEDVLSMVNLMTYFLVLAESCCDPLLRAKKWLNESIHWLNDGFKISHTDWLELKNHYNNILQHHRLHPSA